MPSEAQPVIGYVDTQKDIHVAALIDERGKSDTVDAEAAAQAALNGEATVVAKTQGSVVESIRALPVAFTSARDSRTWVAL